jgi:Leucine Rich Repeat (LRR) protein
MIAILADSELDSLALRRCEINKEKIKVLAQNGGFTELDLEDNPIGLEGIKAVIQQNDKLSSLNLNRVLSKENSDTCRAAVKILHDSDLSELDLLWNPLDDEDIEVLAQGDKLSHLSVSDESGLSESGIEIFKTNLMSGKSHLSSYGFACRSSVSEEKYEELREAFRYRAQINEESATVSLCFAYNSFLKDSKDSNAKEYAEVQVLGEILNVAGLRERSPRKP